MGSFSERAIAVSVPALIAALLLSLVPAVAEDDTVAAIGETGYATLADAISAAEDGDRITLVSDTTETGLITIDKSLTIDGSGYGYGGTFILDSFNVPESPEYTVVLENLIFTSSAGRAVQSEKAGTEEEVVRSFSLTISACAFASTETNIELGSDTVSSPPFRISLSTASDANVTLVADDCSLNFELAQGTKLSGSFTDGYTVRGVSYLSGNTGDVVSVYAAGTVTIADYTGTVWFDSSESQGIVFLPTDRSKDTEDSDKETVIADTKTSEIIVNSNGMTVSGDTGTSDVMLRGNFTVTNDDLYVGASLIVSEGSMLTIASGARVSGGSIENYGTIELYGILANDVLNEGTMYTHVNSVVSGDISGNTPITPIPATITTVLYATVGELFEMDLNPADGTTVTDCSYPYWMTLKNGVLSGTPSIEGEFDVKITAESDEFTVSYYYTIVVNPAPEEEHESNTSVWLLLAILAVAMAAIALRAARII